MEDAEHYARWLINSCLDCYKKELEDRRKWVKKLKLKNIYLQQTEKV
jgi:hypothetical protein